jgi:hypothetical protein
MGSRGGLGCSRRRCGWWGRSKLHLVASSSANNTDWFAKISDVAPDGSESIVTEQSRASTVCAAAAGDEHRPLRRRGRDLAAAARPGEGVGGQAGAVGGLSGRAATPRGSLRGKAIPGHVGP